MIWFCVAASIALYEDFYKQVVDIAKIQFDRPVTWFDIGCGTGKMADAAFKAVNIDKFVFCDNSERMLEIARNRFKNTRTQFILSSFLDLQLTIPFDVITAIQVFHYFQKEDRIKAIKKCYDNLSSNGIFITFENFALYSEVGKHLLLERWKSYQLSQGKDIASCNAQMNRCGKKYFPISISEHLELLRQCGFGQAEVIWVSNMQVGLLGIKS